jgi:ATP-dependent Clp protease ATP-binding subunit ClpC
VRVIEERLLALNHEKEEAIVAQEYEKAAKIRDDEVKTRQELEDIKNAWEQDQGQNSPHVTKEDVAYIVSSWTGIPVTQLGQEDSERLLKMEEILHRRVIGQDEAIKAISRSIRRSSAGLRDPVRPIGSFIFSGPTGVGKTELAKALAEVLFGNEDAMVRLDMSEYMEKHTVSRLIGSPPGYVGHDEGGQLTDAVRRKPYSVVLLDEIEKAHPDVFNTLLQVLEDGRLTDSKGRTVNCRNAILIMTSNVGAASLRKEKSLGFVVASDPSGEYKRMKSQVLGEVKKAFKPEFLNRLDEVIVFHRLEDEELKSIVNLMLEQMTKRLEEQEIKIEFGPALRQHLVDEGNDPMYGARPLRRAIQRIVEDELSEKRLLGELEPKTGYFAEWEKDGEEGRLALTAETKETPEMQILTEEPEGRESGEKDGGAAKEKRPKPRAAAGKSASRSTRSASAGAQAVARPAAKGAKAADKEAAAVDKVAAKGTKADGKAAGKSAKADGKTAGQETGAARPGRQPRQARQPKQPGQSGKPEAPEQTGQSKS